MSDAKLASETRRGPSLVRARALLLILLLVPGIVFLMVWCDWLVGGDGALDALNGPGVAILFLGLAR